MKTVILSLFILMFGVQLFAQTPPSIRKPKAPSAEEALFKRQGFFRPGTSFEKGKRYYSEDNKYAMVCQPDGNLVVYKFAAKESYSPIWNTKTVGRAVKTCVFQSDGNLVLYDYANKAVWDSVSDQYWKDNKKIPINNVINLGNNGDVLPAGSNPYMVMQSDGNLVIYSDVSTAVDARWSSGSFERNK